MSKKYQRDFKGVWISKEIWLSKDLTLQEKVFLVEIDSLDNECGCFATNRHFADFFGLSSERARKVIASLKDKGYISIFVDKENNNKRTMRVKKEKIYGWKQPEGMVENDHRGGWKQPEGMVENDHYNNTVNNTSNIYSANELAPSTPDVKEKQKTENNNNDLVNEFFERVWSIYPTKKGKGKVSDSKKKELFKIAEELERCISRYVEYVKKQRKEGFEDLRFQNGSTFFNSGYVDYLDKNYKTEEVKKINKGEEYKPNFIYKDI